MSEDLDLPLPGPGERGGVDEYLRKYERSSSLMWLNPFQANQALRQLFGEGKAMVRWKDQPPSIDSYRQQTTFTLPFEGEWLIMNGGTDKEHSHSWELLGQRYAYDFLRADANGRRHKDGGYRVEDYFAYGAPIMAPADGEIVRVRSGVRDAPHVGTGWVDWRSRDFTGNSVTIGHAEREFSFLAHLAANSIVVKVGQRVRRGELLARCGNSGHSTEPHLHFQVQDQLAFLGATSLPVAFSGCVVDEIRSSEPVYLQRGSRIQPAN
jgi:murein DD-endopeptidase MepM/ murein hydrolase activator NlpD